MSATNDEQSPRPCKRLFLYLTYRCDLRCRHCYLKKKSQIRDLDVSMASEILKWFSPPLPTLTMLGGEPTLYPKLQEIISCAKAHGYPHIKIETNGGPAFIRLLAETKLFGIDEVAFSVDGCNSYSHALTRGQGSFESLMQSLRAVQNLNMPYYAILSISNLNVEYAARTIHLCAKLGCSRVTVHYVTSRGDASPEIALTPDQWRHCRKEVGTAAREASIEVRWEETFGDSCSEDVGLPAHGACVVPALENLMVMPTGTAYLCTMFLDRPDLAAFRWSDGTFRKRDGVTELDLCSPSTATCPGFFFTGHPQLPPNMWPLCAFKKTVM